MGMSYIYVCRCCGMKMAELDDSRVTETDLGLTALTPDERQHIMATDQNGDTVVKVICDYCRDGLNQYPELSLIGTPLQ
jgi:hypothetical protein